MNYKNIMRNIILYGILFFSVAQTYAEDNIFSDTGELPYCDSNECGYQEGVVKVKGMLNDAETSKTLSEYIQDVIIYLLTFITIIAVIYIIYAGFRIMIGGGSDDAMKNSRKTILNVAIGIVIIWLSYSIVYFIIDILDSASQFGT